MHVKTRCCKGNQNVQTIQVDKFRNLLNQDQADEAVILDVRTRGEHASERIVGTMNMPLDEIEQHLEELRKYKHVYVHCASGNRSKSGCAQLTKAGFKNIYNFNGGTSAWKSAGFSLE